MTRKTMLAGVVYATVMSLATVPSMLGQTAPAAETTASPMADETVKLSPFIVEATEGQNTYRANSTLAGTRVRTDLKDVASSISVVTSQFLQDTGAKNQQDLLVYTTNTEVGGIWGNFSGAAGSSTFNENTNLLRPAENTRVRGLASADNTRDYFLTEIPWDGYNVGRVDLQRGPNSILFGVGSPAGIVNTSVNTAGYKEAYSVETRFDKYGSFRVALDINHVILPHELALRIAAVDDHTYYQQDPAFNHDRRYFGAMKYEPKLFGPGAQTMIRANYEHGEVNANRPRMLPPIDAITPWFKTGSSYGFLNMNKMMVDPTTTWNVYGGNTANPPGYPNQTYPWFREAFMGRLMSSDIANFYNYNSSAPIQVMMPNPSASLGIDSTGAIDGTINGIIFQRMWGISTFNKYARGVIPGGKYYTDTSLSDSSIFDFYGKLIDGDNKREWQNWQASNVAISQTFFDNRLGFEFVNDYQRYKEGQKTLLNGDQYQISVDINTKLLDGSDNPNVGRPYVGNSGQYGNTQNEVRRDSQRLTATGELRADDFMDSKSLLAKILGKHVFTGMYSQDLKRQDNRNFARWASEPAYTDTTSSGGANGDITNGARQIDWIAYIGPSLATRTSAAGANLSNVTAIINPSGYEAVRFFDSHWRYPAGTGVNPADPYTYTIPNGVAGALLTTVGTQADNPANYVGWRTQNFRILNADNGDIDQLWTAGTRNRNKIKSKSAVWQGYLFDGNLVPVFGWRRDEVSNASTQAPKGPYQVAMQNYSVDTSEANTRRAAGESKSYGAVLHMPRQWREKSPYGTSLSVFANRSENFKADAPRGDIFGTQIPNPVGKTKEYGFVISTLDDKLSLKTTWYETKVQNASLQADSAGFSGSLYYVWALPYWGATHALAAQDGISTPQLRQGNWGWPWNGIATLADGSPDNARIQAIIRDFFVNFPLTQRFADEYGLGMNVARMHSTNVADWYASIPTYGVNGQGASALGLQPAYGGNLRDFGSGPVASVDTTSKGIEFEVSAQPMKNWNITANAAKTEASRTGISPTIDTWISTYTRFLAGDAGLIKIWGGDTARVVWASQVLAPYSVLKSQIGSTAPEVAKWRFNLASTYNFDNGTLKGAFIGGAYRWEGKRILGYRYKVLTDTLDINNPLYGPSDEHFDLWVGYSRKVTSKINWRIQLNVRNVGQSTGLVPVSLQPDGTTGFSRIQEGMGWQLTNTFSF